MNEQLYEQALLDPMSVYSKPVQVLRDPDLSDEQKLRILRRWETDSRELQVAEDEGMIGGERDLYSEVLQAIHTVLPATQKDRLIEAPTKQGGVH
ncbi:MAG: hypothetical protein ABR612_11145 [Chromatocurvus sp.]